MAELFLCGGESIYFSNGETAALFEGWERLALADPRSGMAVVAAFLRQRLDSSGAGCMAFGMDREFLPDELAGPDEAATLLVLVERTAADPTLLPDVNWSPELLASWRERLGRMAEALRWRPK